MNKFWDDELPASYYDDNLISGLNKNRGIQANWHNITFQKVKSLMPQAGKHLDYACGPGSFIGNYLNLDSVGVDISTNQINVANSKYSKKGKFLVGVDFDFNDYQNYFDVVTVIGLLEYLDDKETKKLINNLSSTLKDNGKIIFTTPNYGGLMKYLEKIMHFLGPVDYSSQNISNYNQRKLQQLFLEYSDRRVEINRFLNLGVTFSVINLVLGYLGGVVSAVVSFYFGASNKAGK